MTDKPLLIAGTNLSDTWQEVLRAAKKHGHELTPFVLSLTDFDECSDFRKKLDGHLISNGHQLIDTVAGTIFPIDLYRLLKYDRNALYKQYMRNFPRIQAIAPHANKGGTYFQRLIDYQNPNGENINQLETIITSLIKGNVKRRSKLQASIFDPTRDHINGMFQGFPCMQHVTFYKAKNGGLILNSFYAMQHLYEKGYGNWLGLINLGKFVARETGLEFQQLNLFAGVEKLEVSNKMIRDLL
jgi:thymidylate synthase